MKIEIVEGINGKAVVLNDMRITTPKIYGLLNVKYTFETNTHYILEALGVPHHARWINSNIPDSILVKCSNCGFDTGARSFKYCPNCGCKMDGGCF